MAGGQVVYINSGLIEAAANANEVQGVIAHELGHVAAGDVLRGSEGIKTATGITILSLVLGAAAIAAGAGEAGAGILRCRQQAALGKYLASAAARNRAPTSRPALPLRRRDQRQGHDHHLSKAAGSGISPRHPKATATTAPTR